MTTPESQDTTREVEELAEVIAKHHGRDADEEMFLAKHILAAGYTRRTPDTGGRDEVLEEVCDALIVHGEGAYLDESGEDALDVIRALKGKSSPAKAEGWRPTREQVVALIMEHVRPQPTKVRLNPRPTIAELEANLNSDNPRKLDLNADGNVYELLPGPPLTAGTLADAILALSPPIAEKE